MTGEKSDDGKKPEGETIDTSSPLYIHPSDYPKQMQVNDLLNDNNYNEWKQEMTNFLLAKNKMGLVDGTTNKPETNTPMHMAWIRADAMIKGWLTTAMEREIRTSVRYANTSSEIWKDLEERFEKEGAPRAYELKQLLNTTRQEGTSVSNYYTKLRSVWDELQIVLPSPRCVCDGCNCSIGKQLNEVKEKERTYEFLMGLDNEFTVIRTQILAMKPAPSLGATYHLVAENEQQRAITGGSKRSGSEAAAFQAHYGAGKTQRQPQTKQYNPTSYKPNITAARFDNEKKEKWCSFCQREGHIREACFKLHGHPEWRSGPSGTKHKEKPKAAMLASPVPGLTDEQYHMFIAHFKDNGGMTENGSQPRANMAGIGDEALDWSG